MFAKRHYEAIALAMQDSHPDSTASAARIDQWHRVKRALAETFKADSTLFDEARFVVACLPGHNVRARTQHLKADASRLEALRELLTNADTEQEHRRLQAEIFDLEERLES